MAPRQCRAPEPRSASRHERHRDVPNLRARRPCRAMRGLRPHARRLQLVPQPPLPEMPVAGGPGLARKPRSGAAAGPLLPCRVHVAGRDRRRRLPNKAAVYGLLFTAAAEVLATIAADAKHLGAEIGVTAVLHTWG